MSAKEADLAKRLIDDMTEHWKPEKFKDTYHQNLMRRIHEKIKSGETHAITEPEEEEEKPRRSAELIDLATLLKPSLDKGTRAKAADVRRATPSSGKTSRFTAVMSKATRNGRIFVEYLRNAEGRGVLAPGARTDLHARRVDRAQGRRALRSLHPQNGADTLEQDEKRSLGRFFQDPPDGVTKAMFTRVGSVP